MTEGAWALLGVAVGAIATGIVNLLQQARQFSHEKEMYYLRNKGIEMVKEILGDMLNHRTHIERSFTALKKRVGGYTDNQIRQFLHEIGAKKTSRKEGEEEWWYLAEREQERLEKRRKNA